MPSLRTLLSDLEPPSVGNPERVFYVVNTSQSQNNGGRCCLWTAPAGTSSVTFEMWGGGADGQGSRCCERAGTMPTSGSYAIKTVDTTDGCQYRICAAGTGCYGCCCGTGPQGRPSYTVDITAGSTIGCAPGGRGGCSDMTRGGFRRGYICCWGLLSGTGLGDVVIDGTGSISIVSQYCNQHMYMHVPGGMGSERMTSAVCAVDMTMAGCSMLCGPPSPGGAGAPGRACGGGYCQGHWGGYGIVKVTYT